MKKKIKEKLVDAKRLAESIEVIKKSCYKNRDMEQYWYHRGRHMMLLTLIEELEGLLKS